MGFRFPLVIAVFLVLAATRPADAYLDANTGSLLIQLLVGGVAGIALVGKLMWHRIKEIFKPSNEEHEHN